MEEGSALKRAQHFLNLTKAYLKLSALFHVPVYENECGSLMTSHRECSKTSFFPSGHCFTMTSLGLFCWLPNSMDFFSKWVFSPRSHSLMDPQKPSLSLTYPEQTGKFSYKKSLPSTHIYLLLFMDCWAQALYKLHVGWCQSLHMVNIFFLLPRWQCLGLAIGYSGPHCILGEVKCSSMPGRIYCWQLRWSGGGSVEKVSQQLENSYKRTFHFALINGQRVRFFKIRFYCVSYWLCIVSLVPFSPLYHLSPNPFCIEPSSV